MSIHHSNNNSLLIVRILGIGACGALVLFQLWFMYTRYTQSMTPSQDAQKISTVDLDRATFSAMAKRLGGQ